MKGCIIAGVILILVLSGVIFNAFYVRNTADHLLQAVDGLPAIPDPIATPSEIAVIQQELEDHAPFLGITVPYSIIDRVSEAFINLDACARSNDLLQYTETLALLQDLIEELSRTERITLKSVL